MGCYGGGITRDTATPQIDKLADKGFHATNFNVESICRSKNPNFQI